MTDRPFRVLAILAIVLLAGLAILPRGAIIGETAGGGSMWVLRAEAFWDALAEGRFGDTLQAPHPGATLLWISGAAIRLTGATALIDRFAAATWPLSVLSGLLVLVIVGLVRRLLAADGHARPGAIALLAGVLLALDPVSLVQSSNPGLDGITGPGVFATYLIGLLHLRTGSRGSLLLAGIAAGFCVATKAPGMFLLPLALLAYLAAVPWRRFRPSWDSGVARRTGGLALAILAGSVVIPFLLIPAFWVEPFATLREIFAGDLRAGSFARVVGSRNPKVFILGEITRHPGPLFYPLNLLFRMTPLVLLGLVILVARGRRRAGRLAVEGVIFSLFLVLVLATIEKKSWRYISLILPALNALAAIGLVSAVGALSPRLRHAAAVLLVALMAVQGAWILSRAPYHGLTFNPVLGGTRVALHAVRVSKGEGLKPTVEFLAAEAERLGRPVTWSGGYTGPDGSSGEEFAPPTVTWIGRNPEVEGRRADYHVLCLAYVQRGSSRLRESDYWWRLNGKIVHREQFDGLDLVAVYALGDDP